MSGLIAPWFLQQFRDVNGAPLAGGKLYFYVAGSTTVPKNVYVDFPCTVPYSQPVILDGSGFAPEYFMEAGLYKIVVRAADNRLIATRDNVAGVGNGSGGVAGATFQISASDSSAGYFSDKIIDSDTVTWAPDDVGGYQRLKAVVNTAGILDYKVKADGADGTPGYLSDKLEAGHYITLSLNSTTHKVKVDFSGPAYVPQSGGSFTGAVSFGGTVMATGGCFFGDTIINGAATISGGLSAGSTVITDLQITGLGAGAPALLQADGAGNVTGVPLTSLYTYLVKHDVDDLIPGYIGTKIVAGTGITINTTTDGVNGVVMHINSNAVPAVSQPANQVVVGTGSGITSFSGLKGTSNSLTAGLAYISTSSSQPSCAYIGTVGGDPGGGNTVGLLVNTTNLLLYSSTSGWIKAQVGASTTMTLDNSLMDIYSATTKMRGAVQMVGIVGAGQQGTLVNDGTGNVVSVGGYAQSVVPFSSYYSFGSSNAIFNLTSLVLGVGTYEVDAAVSWNAVGSFGGAANISTTSVTIPTDGWDQWTVYSATFSGSASVTISRKRIVVASGTQTVYLCAQGVTGSFTGGRAWGHLSAKQIY